jgi:DNA (cytosine-5)-methyltransferase 1
MIKVVDLFAGPGGLGEGFSAYMTELGVPAFDVGLSIEKDPIAGQTLKLRKFFRAFSDAVPREYYALLRRELSVEELYARYPGESAQAEKRTLIAELGRDAETAAVVRRRIDQFVADAEPWVLIGGPPCQAYSLVGRARNRGNPSYDPDTDKRQRLYVEYLQILADHAPAAFVMENVKGLLSASLQDQALFKLIVSDLQNPATALRRDGRRIWRRRAVRYTVFSVSTGAELGPCNIGDAVVRAEDYGVPQARHRVILIGIRSDLNIAGPARLEPVRAVPAGDVLLGLPALRSGFSRRPDSDDAWVMFLKNQRERRWATSGAASKGGAELRTRIQRTLDEIGAHKAGRGSEFVPGPATVGVHSHWYLDRRLDGVVNHTSRGHMDRDLCRYLYAACFAQEHGRSPLLRDFPADLLPDHVSAQTALRIGGNFEDRFRVQLETRPATTVVSHISKDGHYYIHPDPLQCRSLTVREAARLQTFPDNYYFCGPRTAQYVQVGNAVPPFLAYQIAERIHQMLQEGR